MMRDTHTELYVHAVWSTWDRLPILVSEIHFQQPDGRPLI